MKSSLLIYPLFAAGLFATTSVLSAPVINASRINIHKQAHSLTLSAQHASFKQALTQLTQATGAVIHYTRLPSEEINGVCTGANVHQIMTCLLQGKADLISRQSPKTTSTSNAQTSTEIWVLTPSCPNDASDSVASAKSTTNNPIEPTEKNPIDNLLEQTSSEDHNIRAQALATLAFADPKHESKIHDTLINALSDPNAQVRVQAIAGIAKRKSADASILLKQALQDSDASVRLMAIDHVGDDINLLQQALTDSDQSVRTLANLKLNEIPTTTQLNTDHQPL